jgi:hypothetical protein
MPANPNQPTENTQDEPVAGLFDRFLEPGRALTGEEKQKSGDYFDAFERFWHGEPAQR